MNPKHVENMAEMDFMWKNFEKFQMKLFIFWLIE